MNDNKWQEYTDKLNQWKAEHPNATSTEIEEQAQVICEELGI